MSTVDVEAIRERWAGATLRPKTFDAFLAASWTDVRDLLAVADAARELLKAMPRCEMTDDCGRVATTVHEDRPDTGGGYTPKELHCDSHGFMSDDLPHAPAIRALSALLGVK